MVMNTKTEAARRQMIEQQVRTWDVLDARVLETFDSVPREKFVPDAYRAVAFADTAIPIGHGQFMLKPALEGRILQALAPVRGERVLEIGTGSGFFAACLAHLDGRGGQHRNSRGSGCGRVAHDRESRHLAASRSAPAMRSRASMTLATR